MCVIIQKPAGIDFPEEDIRLAHENNPHGFGYVYYNPKEDRLICKKSVGLKIETIIAVFKELVPYEAIFHFRWATKGAQTNKQCHPFRVLNKEYHGTDMFFVHNGTISNVETKDKEESDTQAFNRVILKPILKKFPEIIEEPAFHTLIQDFVSSSSKLCFMYGKGQVWILNSDAGKERHGCWISNPSAFVKGSRNSTTTTYTYPYHSRNTQNQSDTAVLLDQIVKVGTEVVVTSPYDTEYVSEGKVTRIGFTSVGVEFVSLDGHKETMSFDANDGVSYMENGLYYVFPIDGEVIMNTDKDKNIIDINFFKEQKKSQLEEKKKRTQETQTTGAETDEKTEVTGDTDSGGGDSSEPYQEIVQHKGVGPFDAKDRWAGYHTQVPL